MVHGGGHHHSSGGGGNSFFSHSHNSGGDSGSHHHHHHHHQQHQHAVSSNRHYGSTSISTSSYNPSSGLTGTDTQPSSGGGCWLYTFLGIAFAGIVGCFAMGDGTDQVWTMNATGESRRVLLPTAGLGFYTELKIQIVGKSFSGRADESTLSIYSIPGSCPPVTCSVNPPPAPTAETMTLGYEDFQYDYFFLNKGSRIDVTASQNQGATTIYLAQGSAAIKCLEGRDNEECFDKYIVNDALLRSFAHEGGSNVTFSFPARANDLYALVYDNASTQSGTLTVQFSLQMKTYCLQGYNPVCTLTHVQESCPALSTRDTGCMIVQASSSNTTTTTSSSSSSSGDIPNTLTVRITSESPWWIFLMVPCLLVVFCACFCGRTCCFPTKEGSEDETKQPGGNNSNYVAGKDKNNKTREQDPLLIAEVPTPPPVAASAPMESDSLLPVAQAQVIVESTSDLPVAAVIPSEQISTRK